MDTAPPDPARKEKERKKVRLACERCRERRIKCDGQTPACGNCAKAQVPCMDVDSRTAEGRISRAFQINAASRIQWLEHIVRTRLPDVDLSEGPQCISNESSMVTLSPEPSQPSVRSQGVKRSYQTANLDPSQDASAAQNTRSMALHLGLISLHVNSSETHYLGSSSGSFFASMLQAHEEENNSTYRLNLVNTNNEDFDDHMNGDGPSNVLVEDKYKVKIAALLETLNKELPSRRDFNELCGLFFRQFHAEFPLIHRPTFENIANGLYECASDPSEASIQPNGWPTKQKFFPCNGEDSAVRPRKLISVSIHEAAAQVFLILAIAASLKTQKRSYQYDPTKFYQVAMSILDIAIGRVTLSALQIIILMALHSFTSPQRCNTWTTLHLGFAFAVDLGMHREVPNHGKFSEAALHMRRRVFYCIYTLERRLSAVQGRPLGFSDDTLDVALPTPLLVDSNDPVFAADQATISASIQFFRMAQLISEIKHDFYLLQKRKNFQQIPDSRRKEMQEALGRKLEAWDQDCNRVIESIPQNDARPDRRGIMIKFKIDLSFAMCLLYQPSQLFHRPNEESLKHCFTHSVQRLRLYSNLYESDQLFFSWRNIHGIFSAGAIMLFCLRTSASLRTSHPLSQIAGDIRLCTNLLSAGGEWWPLVRKARASFERVANSTLQALANRSLQPQLLPVLEPQMLQPPSNSAQNQSGDIGLDGLDGLDGAILGQMDLDSTDTFSIGSTPLLIDGFPYPWNDFQNNFLFAEEFEPPDL